MANASKRRDAASTAVENALKTVVANIRFMGADAPVRSIVITSSVPNEGKTFVATRLAEALATSGKSTLLMECDLRRRSVASRLGTHARHGMYAALMNQVRLEDAIVQTKTPRLDFLDAEPGIPNPSDLFSSKRFSSFLDMLDERYDYVVIDTPPVSAFADAAVLSHLADATLLVVRENFTHREQLVETYAQLQKADGNVTGVIMNGCKRRHSEYYQYYYSKGARDTDARTAPQPVAARPLDAAGRDEGARGDARPSRRRGRTASDGEAGGAHFAD